MRSEFCKEMVLNFQQKKFVFLTGDLGFKALEPLQNSMEKYFINAGVAEQNMVSVSAGISKAGIKSWVYSIAPFAYARPFEQIRNDVCLHNLPVTIVGNGGGYGYGVMGGTHHAIEDYGCLLSLQNMKVFVPAFAVDLKPIIANINKTSSPTYLRLGLNESFDGLVIPEYSAFRKLMSGNLGILLVCGSIAGQLLQEFSGDNPNERPSIWIITELPFENLPADILEEISKTKTLGVVEEHVANGGLGGMVATYLLKHTIKIERFFNLTAQGYISGYSGSQKFFRKESGLTKQNILKNLNNA
jgi:transketolase